MAQDFEGMHLVVFPSALQKYIMPKLESNFYRTRWSLFVMDLCIYIGSVKLK